MKHLALEIELPAVYTADIDSLREFQGDFTTEGEFLLNCVGEPSVVRVRMEISGEKDSSVEEVWGHIRDARLVEPAPGYGPGAALTDEQLAENGERLLRDERGCEWCHVATDEAPPVAKIDAAPFALVNQSTEARNRYWLVCRKCLEAWPPNDVKPGHAHLNDDWKRCDGELVELRPVEEPA